MRASGIQSAIKLFVTGALIVCIAAAFAPALVHIANGLRSMTADKQTFSLLNNVSNWMSDQSLTDFFRLLLWTSSPLLLLVALAKVTGNRTAVHKRPWQLPIASLQTQIDAVPSPRWAWRILWFLTGIALIPALAIALRTAMSHKSSITFPTDNASDWLILIAGSVVAALIIGLIFYKILLPTLTRSMPLFAAVLLIALLCTIAYSFAFAPILDISNRNPTWHEGFELLRRSAHAMTSQPFLPILALAFLASAMLAWSAVMTRSIALPCGLIAGWMIAHGLNLAHTYDFIAWFSLGLGAIFLPMLRKRNASNLSYASA